MLVCRLWGVAMTLPTTAAACPAALAATARDSAVVTAVAVLSPSLTIQPPGLGGPGLCSMPKWCWTSGAAIVMCIWGACPPGRPSKCPLGYGLSH